MEKEMDKSSLNNMVRFEYLSNLVKLQYLRDCFKGPINTVAASILIGYFQNEIIKAKILHSDYGRAFLAYLNNPVYLGGSKGNVQIGPLIKRINPKESTVFEELYEVNRLIKEEIRKSAKWFQIFCEYVLVKISIHELIVDISDEENGYSDLMNLIKISQMNEIQGANLRWLVIYAMRLGLDPLSGYNGYEQEISHLNDCKYTEFMSKRDEWCERANYALSIGKKRMSQDRLTLVTQWDKYSMCAFDCGPVFLRKRKVPLVSKLCFSFSEYSKWNENKALKDKMKEIIEKDAYILIGRYSDYFGSENDTVEYFQENREFVENIEKMEEELKSKWERLNIDQGGV
jgi:hypothetical protein